MNPIERKIVSTLIGRMLDAVPEKPIRVWDGDSLHDCGRDRDAVVAIVFGLDEAVVRIGREWVYIVLGNGEDVIADCGDTKIMRAATAR
jgi:hypothetical protein